jgi:hypothetical protein
MITNSTGVERNDWPSDGGLFGNAIAPGICCISGRNSSVICCCFFVRSSHGFSRRTALPSTTVGNPRSPCTRPLRGSDRTCRSIGAIMSPCTAASSPCGAGDNAEYDAAVLGRRELGLELREQQRAQAQYHHPRSDHHPAMVERPRERATVAVGHRHDPRFDEVIDP